MRKILLIIIIVIALLVVGCSTETYSPAVSEPNEQTIEPADALLTERTQVKTEEQIITETTDEVLNESPGDINGWGWKEEYGYYVVDNYRWDYLTVWYDPYEQSYSLDHPYSSLSNEHIKNGTTIYPINEPYTNEYGNTFIPFEFTDLKHPEYEDDGDGVYWILYENFNGQVFLDYYPQF